MDRIRFGKGKQREFLNLAMRNLNCVNLRGLLQYGLESSYPSLKNYYSERRLLPKSLFLDICYLIKKDPSSFNVVEVGGNWGQIKGGKLGKRYKSTKK